MNGREYQSVRSSENQPDVAALRIRHPKSRTHDDFWRNLDTLKEQNMIRKLLAPFVHVVHALEVVQRRKEKTLR